MWGILFSDLLFYLVFYMFCCFYLPDFDLELQQAWIEKSWGK